MLQIILGNLQCSQIIERPHMSVIITGGRERPYGLDYDVTLTPVTSFVQPLRYHCCGRLNTVVLLSDVIRRSFPVLLLRGSCDVKTCSAIALTGYPEHVRCICS